MSLLLFLDGYAVNLHEAFSLQQFDVNLRGDVSVALGMSGVDESLRANVEVAFGTKRL